MECSFLSSGCASNDGRSLEEAAPATAPHASWSTPNGTKNDFQNKL
jgi:hypothetical protein